MSRSRKEFINTKDGVIGRDDRDYWSGVYTDYLTCKNSITISNKYGLDVRMLKSIFVEHGYNFLSKSDSRKGKIKKESITSCSGKVYYLNDRNFWDNVYYNLFVNQNISEYKIADILGITRKQLRRVFYKINKYPSKTEIQAKSSTEKSSSESELVTDKYLTEELLGVFLSSRFDVSFIRNKRVPDSGIPNRPDYRNEELKLIVEFDGYHHYTTSSTIVRDIHKDSCLNSLGYTIIRIPYFVQLNEGVIKFLFKDYLKYMKSTCNFNSYPHGFIDDSACLPANYCEIGLNKYISDLNRFYFIKKDIVRSLKNKISSGLNILEVVPPSLKHELDI